MFRVVPAVVQQVAVFDKRQGALQAKVVELKNNNNNKVRY